MISYRDYLQLLPKTELHCHLTSTLTAGQFIRLAKKYGLDLPTTDPARLFAFEDLVDFLDAFHLAHQALREPQDFFDVAYEGVRHAVASGALAYREYYVNPQYFESQGLDYQSLIDPIIEGLRAAKEDFGVDFRIVVAIARNFSPESAVALVQEVLNHPCEEVVGIGMDDLTPEKTEDPMRFQSAIRLAQQGGLKTTAHVGETDNSSVLAVRQAIFDLKVDRIDHGYRIVDDPSLMDYAREHSIHFCTTPISTTICSGWLLDHAHPIARMIRAGLHVNVSTDDAMFFRTDIGKEYSEALYAFGVKPEQAKSISLSGIDAAFCDTNTKNRLRSEFNARFLALNALLDPESIDKEMHASA